ncbi:Alpha/Beta hydrolase protein [Elsinoe ampelina]|uniref:Alpha/Beta hydrolase protein n=1 Tax=Elsinoe ampelina TaxID=302913 RepID=A0A6A6G4L6_9PEZI|nr:Alpha/Beta hydrolase protein [Elsinoe ampelina]
MHIFSSLLLLGSLGAVASARGGKGRSCDVKLKTGEASGELRNIAGDTQVYFSGPADSETGVLFLTDIFGINFINSQLVADSFGAQGYYTVMPDLFRGDPVPVDRPASFNITEWQSRNQPANIDPVIELALNEIRTNTNIKRLGVVGYCFGGKYVARFLGRNAGINAGYTAHPSNVAAAEWAAVNAPLSIANAELDTTWPLAQARLAEDILRNSSVAWQLDTYSDVPHGFGIRANDSLPRQVFAKEQAFVQAVTWFGEYVKPANGTSRGPSGRKSYGAKSFDDEHRAVVAG